MLLIINFLLHIWPIILSHLLFLFTTHMRAIKIRTRQWIIIVYMIRQSFWCFCILITFIIYWTINKRFHHMHIIMLDDMLYQVNNGSRVSRSLSHIGFLWHLRKSVYWRHCHVDCWIASKLLLFMANCNWVFSINKDLQRLQFFLFYFCT